MSGNKNKDYSSELKDGENRYVKKVSKISRRFGLYELVDINEEADKILNESLDTFHTDLRDLLSELINVLTGKPDRITLSNITIRDGDIYKKNYSNNTASIEAIIECGYEIYEEIKHEAYKGMFKDTITEVKYFYENKYYFLDYLYHGLKGGSSLEKDYIKELKNGKYLAYDIDRLYLFDVDNLEETRLTNIESYLTFTNIEENRLPLTAEKSLIKMEDFPYEEAKSLMNKVIRDIESIKKDLKIIINNIENNYSDIMVAYNI